jgi:hypothetical protein
MAVSHRFWQPWLELQIFFITLHHQFPSNCVDFEYALKFHNSPTNFWKKDFIFCKVGHFFAMIFAL